MKLDGIGLFVKDMAATVAFTVTYWVLKFKKAKTPSTFI